MLVLSRKKNESIVLYTQDGEITITVVAFVGPQIRIGIDAPKSVDILRKELVEDKS